MHRTARWLLVLGALSAGGCRQILGLGDPQFNESDGGASGGASVATASSGSNATAQSSGSSGTSGSSGSGGSGSSSASASSSSGGSIPTCDEQYGTAPGYQLCPSAAGVCEFSANLDPQSCGTLCAERGGECKLTIDNRGAACTYKTETQNCTFTNYAQAICRCTLGCGGGPACASPKTCNAGQCV